MQLTALEEKTLKKQSQQIRLSAMNLLARREHSVKELTDKLKLRYFSSFELQSQSELIETVVDELTAQDLQSNQRFTESFIRVRAGQGKGPLRISQELKQRGITQDEIQSALKRADIDWFELALSVYQRKFYFQCDGIDTSADARLEVKDQVKRQRYLSYRGFSFEQITYALNPSE